MQKTTFNLEKKLVNEGYDFVIGIDEAGRGPLAGPVVAAAATVRNSQFPNPNFPAPAGSRQGGDQTNSNDQIFNDKNWDLIRDSKTLSEKQRENLFDFIHENFHVGVGICDHETIDRINILEATYLAAKKAITSLTREISNNQIPISNKNPNSKTQISNESKDTKYKIPDIRYIILFDGNKVIPNLSMEQRAVVGGDKFVKSISAASIIAKVTRDRIMLEMHAKFPQYCFDRHKGYGTKLHMTALQENGPCEIHRQSFGPVKKVLN